jgi:hypothetical protein
MKTFLELPAFKTCGLILACLLVLLVSSAGAAPYAIRLITDQLDATKSAPICALNNRGQILWSEPQGGLRQTKIWRYQDGVNTLVGTYPYVLNPSATNKINDLYYNDHNQLVASAEVTGGTDVFLLDGADLSALLQSAVTKYKVEGDPKITNSGYSAWGEFHFISLYVSRIARYLTGNYLYLNRGPSIGAWHPRVNNQGQMVWAELVGDKAQIFFYDGTNTTNITDDSRQNQNPMINDRGEMLWYRLHEPYDGTNDLLLYRQSDGTTQTVSAALKSNYNLYLLNNRGQVLYVAADGLHFWEAGTDTFIEPSEWVKYPALNDQGQAAYEDTAHHLRLYDHRNGSKVTVDSSHHSRGFLQINECGQILWANVGGGPPTYELYLAMPRNAAAAVNLLLMED